MIVAAVRLITTKTTSWIFVCLVSCITSAPLVEVVGHNQRIAGVVGAATRARAGHLADGAAPLQLQFRQIALEPGAGEQRRVEAAEGQIDDSSQVGVSAGVPFL